MSGTVPVVAFLTMKGGVGKTTLAANVTRAIADKGRRKILLIDADSQCNLTQIFRSTEDLDRDDGRSICQAFEGHKVLGPSDIKTTLFTHPGNGSIIDLIPGSCSTFALSVISTPAVLAAAEQRFQNFIKQAASEYDLVVIDTNPSATFVTMQALAASNFLVAPITFDIFSMRGIHLITNTLRDRHKWLSNPRQLRIVPNKIPRAHSDADLRRQLEDEKRVRDTFPLLNECITLERVRESKLLSNRLPRRGFLQDQAVSAFTRGAKSAVVEDLSGVATALIQAFGEAFGDDTRNQADSVATLRGRLSAFLGGAVARPN